MMTLAADRVGVGSLSHAVTARKYAFMVREMTATRRKKMLSSKSELINPQQTTRETHKNRLAPRCSQTIKYKTTESAVSVTKVIGYR